MVLAAVAHVECCGCVIFTCCKLVDVVIARVVGVRQMSEE